jgi:hypothetical protein
MNEHLQNILNIIQQTDHSGEEQKVLYEKNPQNIFRLYGCLIGYLQ